MNRDSFLNDFCEASLIKAAFSVVDTLLTFLSILVERSPLVSKLRSADVSMRVRSLPSFQNLATIGDSLILAEGRMHCDTGSIFGEWARASRLRAATIH